MPYSSKHINWLIDTGKAIKTSDGRTASLCEFTPDFNDSSTFSSWAKHFRNHYCLDTEIDLLRDGTGLSRTEYLNTIKFPDLNGFGPGIRAGDFGEILVADYLQYVLNHWVPRTRYGTKVIKNESTKGSDLIGFKIFDDTESNKDVLTIFEVKTQFSGTTCLPRLQNAIDDSAKDHLRKAESLNATKQRLIDLGDIKGAKKISRFQRPDDLPYKEQYGAAALYCDSTYRAAVVTSSNANAHPNKSDLIMLVITSKEFMKLVHKLYEIAANEA